jgi:hypothetical protein
MVKETSPSDFDDILRTLPDYEDARDQGLEYFDDSNVTFWNAVENWERKLKGA